MPTKYGLTLTEIWQFLGVDVTTLSLAKVNELLKQTNFSFLYLPLHFPLAHNLVQYRDEIGKRPPLATLELIWQPYGTDSHLMAGYVHPPTEKMIREALAFRNVKKFTLIKGLEGSGDLKLTQTNIIVVDDQNSATGEGFQYLKVNPIHFNLKGNDPPLSDISIYFNQLKSTIEGEETPLTLSAIFNGGFYLWRCGIVSSIEEGLTLSESLIKEGKLKKQLEKICRIVDSE